MSKSLLCVVFLLCSVGPLSAEPSESALFVSVIQDPPVLSSRREIVDLVRFAKAAGVRTLFVQVYRANRAWFSSALADDSPYESCRKSVGEDPLSLLLREAHASGIEIHAWLNLLSVGANADAPLLRQYGPSVLTRNLEDKKILEDYKIDNQFFLEPGDPRVREALGGIVAEVLAAYPALDGIQFDYIRYPDWHPKYGYAEKNTERFRAATGGAAIVEESVVWKNWKRAQVTELLEELVHLSRSLRPGLRVSTTGLMPYSRANLEAYQDWKAWLDGGLVDFVTLMCYSASPDEFDKYIADARRQFGSLEKVNLAVGAYMLLDAPEAFAREWGACEAAESRACVALHYGNLLENPVLAGPVASRAKSDG